MFILWSEQEYDKKYILFAKETLDEIKDAFSNFCQQKNIQVGLIEGVLDTVYKYSKDHDFYYSNIEDVDINKKIYIFKFHGDGEGGTYHDEYYFEISNNIDELLDSAIEFFLNESEDKDIREMFDVLSKHGQYQIQGDEYSYSMEIFEFV
jgi:hypothetical protein